MTTEIAIETIKVTCEKTERNKKAFINYQMYHQVVVNEHIFLPVKLQYNILLSAEEGNK